MANVSDSTVRSPVLRTEDWSCMGSHPPIIFLLCVFLPGSPAARVPLALLCPLPAPCLAHWVSTRQQGVVCGLAHSGRSGRSGSLRPHCPGRPAMACCCQLDPTRRPQQLFLLLAPRTGPDAARGVFAGPAAVRSPPVAAAAVTPGGAFSSQSWASWPAICASTNLSLLRLVHAGHDVHGRAVGPVGQWAGGTQWGAG